MKSIRSPTSWTVSSAKLRGFCRAEERATRARALRTLLALLLASEMLREVSRYAVCSHLHRLQMIRKERLVHVRLTLEVLELAQPQAFYWPRWQGRAACPKSHPADYIFLDLQKKEREWISDGWVERQNTTER